MTEKISEQASGFSAQDVERFVSEAEAGYDLNSCEWETNPHLNFLHLVPEDLASAISRRAELDNVSDEEVVRKALENYLRAG